MSTAPAILTSNGRPIPNDGDHFGILRSSDDLAGDPEAMRARFEADGYVVRRGLLDRDEVLALRAAYYESHERRDPSRPHGVEGHPAHAFVRTEAFRRFAEQPALTGAAAELLDGAVLVLPRRIVREYRRGTNRSSRAHADHPYIDRGTERVLTAWIPIGDCPVAAGPLVYLEGSHQMDRGALTTLRAVTDRPEDTRALSHDLAWVSERLERRWLATDLRAGDVVFHSPHIVHASLDATTDEPRLSTDIRFIPVGDAADPRWSGAWSGDDGY
jgi:ectoine hydroxylase-related dioxygenase (phytanoyl-CoA dioxygenase family)